MTFRIDSDWKRSVAMTVLAMWIPGIAMLGMVASQPSYLVPFLGFVLILVATKIHDILRPMSLRFTDGGEVHFESILGTQIQKQSELEQMYVWRGPRQQYIEFRYTHKSIRMLDRIENFPQLLETLTSKGISYHIDEVGLGPRG